MNAHLSVALRRLPELIINYAFKCFYASLHRLYQYVNLLMMMKKNKYIMGTSVFDIFCFPVFMCISFAIDATHSPRLYGFCISILLPIQSTHFGTYRMYLVNLDRTKHSDNGRF